MQEILILGAGELGTAIIRALASHEAITTEAAHLTIAVRNPVTGSDPRSIQLQHFQSQGIRVIQLDIASATDADLITTLRQFTTVIGCLGFSAGSGVQLKVAKAVIAARVSRYIPWQFGIDYDIIGRGSTQPLFDEQLDVRDVLRAQDSTDWIIVQTGVFTSFMFEPAWGVIDLNNKILRALGSWDTGISATAPEDIGVSVRGLVLDEGEWDAHKNSKVNVAGDTASYARIADIVERLVQEKKGSKVGSVAQEGQGAINENSGSMEKFTREEWTVPYLIEEHKKDSEDVIKRYRPVFAAGKGVAWERGSTYNEKRGYKTITIEDFARGWLQMF